MNSADLWVKVQDQQARLAKLERKYATVKGDLRTTNEWVTEYRDALVACEAQLARYKAVAEAARDALDSSMLGSINFHMGPNARVAVSQESIAKYERLKALRDQALAALDEKECVCAETSTRNCPVHTKWEARQVFKGPDS